MKWVKSVRRASLLAVCLLGCGSISEHAAGADVRPWIGKAPAVRLQSFAGGFNHPVFLTSDGTDRIFVVEQPGVVSLVVDGKVRKKPYLDISREVAFGDERGLLSIAFHPDFAKNGKLYAYYSNDKPSLHSVISEFTATAADADSVDPKTERVLLTVNKPFSNHNGGQLQFGVDGYLYTGTGDGGSGGDPGNRAQNGEELLGKILRIDVDHRSGDKPYGIPQDNPFVGRAGYRPEIWAVGMRNPWRFSFDRQTHDLWAGDVGQDKWEEIDIITRGGNYGWHVVEGTHPFRPVNDPPPIIGPVKDYPHDRSRRDDPNYTVWGNCIIGGYVYRGHAVPDLEGWYVYGDYSSSWIAAIRYEDRHLTGDVLLSKVKFRPSGFGEDKNGELYVCDHDRGIVYKIVGG